MFGYKIQKYAGEVTHVHGDGTKTTVPLKQCCHCGRHWEVLPAGVPRMVYHCSHCDGDVCSPECEICIPYEKQILAIAEGIVLGNAFKR